MTSCTTGFMELNYGNILNIIIESESLESPDWIWKARVGGDFYPGHWVCGCKLAGISGDYYNPDDIGNPLKVVALPPEEEPFYEYGGNPGEEDRRRFYVLKEPCCREPVERSELFVHALVFRKIALNIARSCGKTEREISGTELIPECLIRLFDFPVTAYFAFAFDERLVSRCLRVIRQAQLERPFLLLVMGKRWRTAAMEAAIVEKYKGIVVSIPDVMVTTKDGFAWAYGYSWEWLRQGMPVHARTGESLPTGAMWEDLWISVTDEREIVFSCSRGGREVKEFMRFSYREEKRFFSRQRAAAGQDSTKPAYKMLFLYVMNPDKACLDKELLKRAGIGNEAEARSDLRKVLVERLPQLAERDPFAKKREKSRQGMYRRFQVVPCKSYIRPLELMLSLERKPERHR